MMGRSGLLGGSMMSGGEDHDLPLAVGTSVGGYVIDRLVARGGCGSVYRAHAAGRAEPVAITLLALTSRWTMPAA
jgi:eukaryotic-like serine/threonine-protein kinase